MFQNLKAIVRGPTFVKYMNATLRTLKYTNEYTVNYYVWFIDLRDNKYRFILTKFQILIVYTNSLSLKRTYCDCLIGYVTS